MPDERLPFVRHYFLGNGLFAVCKNVKCRGFVLYVATAFDIGLHDYGIIAFIICNSDNRCNSFGRQINRNKT